MRALSISCGVAVLFASLGFIHMMVHNLQHEGPGFHRMIVAALIGVGALSLVGGCLLLGRPR